MMNLVHGEKPAEKTGSACDTTGVLDYRFFLRESKDWENVPEK
jgi:hypothetical protein